MGSPTISWTVTARARDSHRSTGMVHANLSWSRQRPQPKPHYCHRTVRCRRFWFRRETTPGGMTLSNSRQALVDRAQVFYDRYNFYDALRFLEAALMG